MSNPHSRIKPDVPVWHPSPYRHDKPLFTLKLTIDARAPRTEATRAFAALLGNIRDGFRQAQTAEILRLHAEGKTEPTIARKVGVTKGRVHAEIFRGPLGRVSNTKHSA